MAFRLVIAAWGFRSELTLLEARVLMEIADLINGKEPLERGTWPSFSKLAKSAGCCRSMAKRCVRSLESKGLIETLQRGARESLLIRLSPRVLNTLCGVQDTLPSGTEYPTLGYGVPGGGVPRTPEPKELNQRNEPEEEPSPPVPPQGGGSAPVRTPRRKKTAETYRSPWLDVWNGLARQVRGLKSARVFSKTSEASLVERGSKLGLEGADLERAISEAVLALGEKPREWVTLSWLATGQKGGLEKLLNGDYGSRNGSSAAPKVETIDWAEERRLNEEAKERLRKHGIPIQGEERA